jgi:uncharacterized membrane protein (UPF0127 family)
MPISNKKRAKLIHNNKIILPNMIYATSSIDISIGLMFSSKKKVKKGMCLVMPTKTDVKFGSSVTMLFCFFDYEILFINSKYEVVDKKILKPFKVSYTPKKPAKYIIESIPGTFKDIKIGDKIRIEIKK